MGLAQIGLWTPRCSSNRECYYSGNAGISLDVVPWTSSAASLVQIHALWPGESAQRAGEVPCKNDYHFLGKQLGGPEEALGSVWHWLAASDGGESKWAVSCNLVVGPAGRAAVCL